MFWKSLPLITSLIDVPHESGWVALLVAHEIGDAMQSMQ
jgi:hypothetical protein